MNKLNLNTIIGLTVCVIMYDYLFQNNTDWFKAIFLGILVMIMMLVVKQ